MFVNSNWSAAAEGMKKIAEKPDDDVGEPKLYVRVGEEKFKFLQSQATLQHLVGVGRVEVLSNLLVIIRSKMLFVLLSLASSCALAHGKPEPQLYGLSPDYYGDRGPVGYGDYSQYDYNMVTEAPPDAGSKEKEGVPDGYVKLPEHLQQKDVPLGKGTYSTKQVS